MTDDRDPNAGDPPDREDTEGRGPGEGDWLEALLAETLRDWGYRALQNKRLLVLEADVVACREQMRDEPADYLIAECKDWDETRIGPEVVIRLCLIAYVASAMPILCHTTTLTDRAWRIAQAYDVRLLTPDDLEDLDDLPPLTWRRPADGTPHRSQTAAPAFRESLPVIYRRRPDIDVEGAVFRTGPEAPCYVTDRQGHGEYANWVKNPRW